VLALIAIALGVALGVAVHLVNASAVNEFDLAAHHLAGQADLVVRGARAGFDESLYPRLARLPEVEAANPALEAEAQLADREEAIRVIGFDPLRAAEVQPALLPERSSMVSALLDADAVLLSPTAAESLGLKVGDALRLSVGTRVVALRVVGLLPHEAYRQRLAVMDIAAAQWRLAHLGRLNRIDLKLGSGVDIERFQRKLERMLPPGVHAVTPESEAARTTVLSRAYRLNLDMLALIALFTGAFLVFSSQVLALLRRRSQLALLRALGVTRAALTSQLVAEGLVIGALGAACGVVLGYLLAHYAVTVRGADLGAGYFRTVTANLAADPPALGLFFVLGVLFATLGAAVPAWEAARRPPARALHAGDEEEGLSKLRTTRWGAAAWAAAIPCTLLPPMDGLPVGGYVAIALILAGSVLLMPRLATAALERLPAPHGVPAAIATAQLKGTPHQAAISIAAVVISMSLMVSMLIMVSSFRLSLETWLEQMLPADLYLRVGRGGETGFLTPEEQARIATTAGIERSEFLRSQNLVLDPERAPVTLLARPVDAANADRKLPLTGPLRKPRPGEPPPVWVSEVAAELYGWHTGERVQLPIGNEQRVCTIAGIWRDYARQNGAIVIDRALYIELTGDSLVNDVALWLAHDADFAEVQRALQDRLGAAERIEISTPSEIRAASLALFDRTFAITYALEAAAVIVGLFGVSVSFSAQALARRREFGMLRHIGMTRREIGIMLGTEGAVVTALGAAFGLAVGAVISLILVRVINRQSFHWTMELHAPWLTLAGLAVVIVAAATVTAVWSGRAAMKEDVVRAVREDW
jgi:putative ABC transport system permease protein